MSTSGFRAESVSLPLVLLLNHTVRGAVTAVYGFLSWQYALQAAVGAVTHSQKASSETLAVAVPGK